mgnify:CR=1 FL=1
MGKKYKFIYFVKQEDDVYNCCNNRSDDVLGQVRWYPMWKQYCYYPKEDTVYNVTCLNDINDFIGSL